ncbi:MAG: DNA topoisomerase IB, partial [Actinobacteria bacterium]|nr:DNA topoisomerase IB [Actinomycetota bacterium]
MARLKRVRPRVDRGFRRVRAGAYFRYLDDDGNDAPAADRDRIHALVIPPAWQEVWITVEPLGHIQAVGTDDAGRTQYVYHARWRARQDRDKFARALALAEALPHARSQITPALRRHALDRDHALAVAFRLLDASALRIGSDRYLARHGSRGLTTLRRRDAEITASLVTLSFPAKSGQRAHLEIDDADLADCLTVLAAGSPRSPLLWYEAGRRHRHLSPADVNAHVRAVTGGDFTAKDFRTLHGTILAADALARMGCVDSARDHKRAESTAVRVVARS